MVLKPMVSTISGGSNSRVKFNGVEEDEVDEVEDEDFIMAMIRMMEGGFEMKDFESFEGGLVSMSGIRLSLPFICLKVKVYCENH